MSNEFWVGFWSNFLSNIAVVAALSIFGYLAKGPIVKGLKQFIKKEVVEAVFTIEDVKEGKPKDLKDLKHDKPV